MQRLPFNPEPLLALFMAKQAAASLTGDLEERFRRILDSRQMKQIPKTKCHPRRALPVSSRFTHRIFVFTANDTLMLLNL